MIDPNKYDVENDCEDEDFDEDETFILGDDGELHKIEVEVNENDSQ